MEISERIKKLGNAFETMQIVPGDEGRQLIYVVVTFPQEWIVDEESADKRNVTVAAGTNPGQYIFCTDIDTGEQAIFDAIDDNIERMKDAMERARLLKETTKKLRELFEDESVPVSKLATITFSMAEDTNDTESEPDVIITKQKDKKK
jgi:hypothetical protein